MTVIQLSGFRLRPWRRGDEDALVRHADDRAVWRNLRDRFPHPYTLDDARWWISHNEAMPRPLFAIEVDGEAAGTIGFEPYDDVHRHTAEMGYWLGRAHWGRGIATAAARAAIAWAWEALPVERIEAGCFGWNAASRRVLEKAGLRLAGVQRRAVFKDGEFTDNLMFAAVRGEWSADEPDS